MSPKGRAPSVAFITLGCPKNEVDSDRMAAAVASSAYSVVEDIAAADIVVLNTCAFIEEATAESIGAALELAGSWLPAASGRKLVVAGCMVSRYGADLSAAMVEVDAFLPVAEEGHLLDLIEEMTGAPATPVPLSTTAASRPGRTVTGPSAYLQISDGCHRACTYCTIPSIRGPYRSMPLDELVAEAQELVSLGAREIVLIGQDITAWGRDLDTTLTISDVVAAIADVEGVRWLRLMYAQPDGVSDELLAVMADRPNVVDYLDMPLQHASSSVLRRMARRGSGEEYLELLTRVRTALPDAALRTTLIAGFPGETGVDSRELQRFIADAAFDYVGVFPFSPEEDTVAATLDNPVPARTRRARAQRLRDLADEVGVERAAERVGTTLEVLVEGYDDDEKAIVGRHRGQAPEIDGIVLLDRGESGDVLMVRVVDSLGYDLIAEVL